MSARSRVGIFGGTFNPIHLGHLRAAEEVVEALGLERMVFVPSAKPPHKRASAEDAIAPAADRLDWVRIATADNPRFQVDPIEVEREGTSYSLDTLRLLSEQLPERPVFAIGHDAFREIDSWREPEELFHLAHFAVIARPPLAAGSLANWIPKCIRDHVDLADDGQSARHRTAGTWIRRLEIRALDVSASDIRARLRSGRSVRYLVPGAVAEALQRSGAYAQT